MQAMTVDAAYMQSIQAAGVTQDTAGTGMGCLEGIFAALFAQLMGETSLLEGQNADELIANLLGGKGKKEEDDPNLLAMQMLAQSLIAPQAIDMPLMQQNAAELLTAIQSATEGAADTSKLTQLVETMMGETKGSETVAEKKDDEWNALLETLTAAWETTGESSEAGQPTITGTIEDQLRFQSALREVREALSEKPRTQETQPTDIEALQQSVNSRQFISDIAAARKEPADIQDIADQVKTGILDNIKQGKNEFVIKLKPEGLGEITVKFSESKNEIALRIITSSTSVGKMIANDVATLQNALRPLRAQVQEIVTVPPSNQSYAAGTALAGEQADKQFTWRNDQQEQNTHTRRRRTEDDFDLTLDEAEEIAPEDANVNLLI